MMKNLLLPSRKSTFVASLLLLFSFMFTTSAFADTDCGQISGFEFSNGNSSTAIANDGSYVIGDLPNNFYIDVLVSGFSESASIKVKNADTGEYVTIGENYLPYTFPAGNGAWNYGPGTYKIKAEIFKYNNCKGSSCDLEWITFTLTNTPSCGQIDGLEFSNFSSDPAVTIADGGTYDIDSLPSNFNINVVTSGMTESASTTLTNVDTGEVFSNPENVLPYTYPGATDSVWTNGCGTFNFCSSVYKLNGQIGLECDSICMTFTITGCEEENCGEISVFEFANGTDTELVVDGGTFDINTLPIDFYIDAIVTGESESVRLTVKNLDTNEEYTIIENYIPYTFPAGNGAWFLGIGVFEVKAEVFSGNYSSDTKCDEQIITFTLNEGVSGDCTAEAGVTVVDNITPLWTPANNALISIIPGSGVELPIGSNYATILTKNGIIRNWDVGLTLTLLQPGNDFKIHLLVYDPVTLDIDSVVIGVTTAQDILNTIADPHICASLDATGVDITIINGGADERVANSSSDITQLIIEEVIIKEVITEEVLEFVKTEELPSLDNNVDIKLYPNPAVDNFNVELLLLDAEVMSYNMIDLNGRQVLKGSFDNSTFGKTNVDVNGITNGLYIITFKSNFRTFSKKIQILN